MPQTRTIARILSTEFMKREMWTGWRWHRGEGGCNRIGHIAYSVVFLGRFLTLLFRGGCLALSRGSGFNVLASIRRNEQITYCRKEKNVWRIFPHTIKTAMIIVTARISCMAGRWFLLLLQGAGGAAFIMRCCCPWCGTVLYSCHAGNGRWIARLFFCGYFVSRCRVRNR